MHSINCLAKSGRQVNRSLTSIDLTEDFSVDFKTVPPI